MVGLVGLQKYSTVKNQGKRKLNNIISLGAMKAMSSLSLSGGLSLSDLWQLLPNSEPRRHQLQHHALAQNSPGVSVCQVLSIYLFLWLPVCVLGASHGQATVMG